jgi:two-component system NtrC family response regulator/two-component system nitrogen regulation response regulator GlnG
MSRRILIVDDDRDMVRTLCDIFTLRGWDTGKAYSGDEAIDAQKTSAYDRVLMDIKMPGLDGISAYKSLSRLFPKLPVVLMTAHRIADVEQTSARVVTKPLDLPALFNMLET